ncbi:MAG: gamma-glutamyltransferase [Pseudomonadota bacterium]
MNADLEQWQVSKRALRSAGSPAGGMVAAQHVLAARAGADMLARGGNAADAAVAAAFALAVVEPWMCGLGGSGLAVLHMAGGPAEVVDFQGVLASAATPAAYPIDPDLPWTIMGFPGVVDRANTTGPRAATVPGAVAGLAEISARFGRLGLDTTLAPAIALAERGVPVDWFATLQIALCAADLARDPGAAAVFLPGGHPPQPETDLPMEALCATLRALAEAGPEALWAGETGAALAGDLAAAGSLISQEDLVAYAPQRRLAETAPHRDAVLHHGGPTSGGTRLARFLAHLARHLEPPHPRKAAPSGADWCCIADGLDVAWAEHKALIGLDMAPSGDAMGSGQAAAEGPPGCTSSLSAVDAEGNMVALTYTLLNRFGAAWLSPRTGILMNNSVAYFDPRPGRPTSIAGGKRINASNMCPVIATHQAQPIFALGASGANHIMPAVAQIAALMLEFGMDLETALNHPRIDASDRGSVRADPRLGDSVLAALAARGPVEIAQRLVFPKLYACPSGVARDPDTGTCMGINDPAQPMGGAASAALFSLPATEDARVERP